MVFSAYGTLKRRCLHKHCLGLYERAKLERSYEIHMCVSCVIGDECVMSMHIERVLKGGSGSSRETSSQLKNGLSSLVSGGSYPS